MSRNYKFHNPEGDYSGEKGLLNTVIVLDL